MTLITIVQHNTKTLLTQANSWCSKIPLQPRTLFLGLCDCNSSENTANATADRLSPCNNTRYPVQLILRSDYSCSRHFFLKYIDKKWCKSTLTDEQFLTLLDSKWFWWKHCVEEWPQKSEPQCLAMLAVGFPSMVFLAACLWRPILFSSKAFAKHTGSLESKFIARRSPNYHQVRIGNELKQQLCFEVV